MSSWIEYAGELWRELDLTALKVDEAYLRIKSSVDRSLWLYSLSEECYKCPYTKLKEIQPNKRTHIKLDTTFELSLKVFSEDNGKYAFDNETALCAFTPEIGEFGVYNLTISSNETCNFVTDKDPVNIHLPIVLVLLVLAGLFLSLQIIFYVRKRTQRAIPDVQEDHESSDSAKEAPTPVPAKKRLQSLDTFRGITMVLMIFVNSGGGKYWWIDHASWNGLHLADIVFPSFLWIMGVCIPISIKSQLSRGVQKTDILKTVIWRSIKLFFLGLFLNSINGPTFEDLRIMGVLQRFGIAYLVVASIYTIFCKEQFIMPQNNIKRAIYDVTIISYMWIFSAIILAIHFGILYGLNVPGCPSGYMGPGGNHDMVAFQNCTGGAAGYIDLKILGDKHIYQHSTARYIYDSKSFDPEGIFGCLLTIFQVILGLQCGITLLLFSKWQSRIIRWSSWAVALGLLGGILCGFSQENGWIPVNKNLWSLSFVLVTSSIDFILLTIFYFIVDVKQVYSGFPFMQCGMNAIILYVGHTVLHKMLPWHWRIGGMNTHFLILVENTWNTLIWVGIALYLYEIKFFYSL